KGASLSKSDAQLLAETYLKSRKDLDFSKYSLVEVVEDKKNERMDYSVVFKDGSFDLGDGSLRASVRIRGDEVGNFSKYVYIPESWYRDNSKSGIRNFIVGVVGFILMLFFLVYTVVSYLRLNRDGLIFWRKGLLYSLPGVVVSLVISLNGLSSYYSEYDGVESLKIFHMKSILSYLLGYVVLILFLAMLFAFLLALVKENVIDPIIPEERGEKKRVLRDAVKMGYAVGLFAYFIAMAIGAVLVIVEKKYDLFNFFITLPELPASLNDFVPMLTDFGEIFSAILVYLPLMLIPVLVVYRYFKRWWAVLASFLVIMLFGIAVESDYKKIITSLSMAGLFAAAIIPLGYFIKRNVLSLLVIFYVTAMLSEIDIAGWSGLYDVKNVILIFLLFLPLGLLYWYFKRDSTSESSKS
ncbi:hypothetical protein HGA64_02760, partial [Candidatus Falkowbacteria bacterium]|nr:hypothetical protein [Candidatus Falkowbacteria bacterium]